MNAQLRSSLLLAVVATLVLSACATPASQVRVDKGETDLATCKSFAWQTPSQDAASFTEQRVRAAALDTLKTKGYAVVDDKPDCKVSHVLSTSEVAKSKPGVGVGVGGGSGGGGVGVG